MSIVKPGSRVLKALAAAGALLLLPAFPSRGQDAPPPQGVDRVDQAISRAIAFLAGVQGKEGSIQDPDRGTHNATVMSALAVMAMAATGHQTTDETKEGAAMKRALAYVLREDRQGKDGYFGEKDGSRMYGHGIITLMLCEMLGMGADAQQDQLVRERARRGVQLILRSQQIKKDARSQGGWRYNPDSGDSDLSVTVWQLMALRSAKNAGLEVPKEAIEQAVGYVKRCYYSKKTKDGKNENPRSACGYEPHRSPEYAMGAAGLLSLQVCGEYEAQEVAGSADWLKDQKLKYESEWFFYGTYYYSQGMYQRGGEYATLARKQVEELLLPQQGKDGSWTAKHGQEQGAGKVYATSLGVLSLAVKCHFMPIYQR
jgi:hypothetical protein